MRPRRIVTGESSEGKAVVVADDRIEPITVSLFPGAEFHRVWGSDELVRLPSEGTPPTAPSHFPPPSGFRFSFFTMAPDAEARAGETDDGAARQEIERKLPGLIDVLEPGGGGRHRTDTTDLNLILAGEVHLLLDDRVEVLLRPGDCVVQNGTRHAWSNRSSVPCVMAVAQVGAVRTTRPPAG